MVRIKNCGLSTPEAIKTAAQTGASFVGFVHYPRSPRHCTIEQIAALHANIPASIASVVVMVDPTNELIDQLVPAIRPHYLQVHGVASVVRLRDIRERAAIPLITGLGIHTREDLAQLADYESISDYLLLDGKKSGSGLSFDWSLLRGIALKKPWFLAGGLTTNNIVKALAITHAPMVDISSGIESAPGVKSLEKIGAFNRTVLAITSHETPAHTSG